MRVGDKVVKICLERISYSRCKIFVQVSTATCVTHLLTFPLPSSNSNSVAQQPMAYCAHPSLRDHLALRYMSRCPHQVVSLKRDPQYLSPQGSLVLIYRLTAVGMKSCVDLAQPENRTRICGVETRYATSRPLGNKLKLSGATVTRAMAYCAHPIIRDHSCFPILCKFFPIVSSFPLNIAAIC
ncbi:hypothetical protein TNCV_2604011 [Trichonephila clavipes]|nr:hypothetical protein TNCV_2604011 [Trichonephila clavipes]